MSFFFFWSSVHLYSFLRLDAIAEDAELQEKSEADLLRLAEYLRRACEDAIKEHNQKLQENQAPEGYLHTYDRIFILNYLSL